MDRRSFLQMLPFAVSSKTLISDDGKTEIIFDMPKDTKEFNGGSHNYLKQGNAKGEIFLPAGIWQLTEIRFVKTGN